MIKNKNEGTKMKKNITSKIIIVLTVLAVVGFGAHAFAERGMGYGHQNWGHHGPGWSHGGQGGSGHGYMMGDLNEDEIEKLEKERNAFFEATEDLRQDLYAKELELRSELAKRNPDPKKAAKLQNDLSKLQARLDQKHIDHMIKMRKINPKAGRRFMNRGGMGYGSSSGGYCWR
jgi:Spy/CpxP family protein refolding chaperone